MSKIACANRIHTKVDPIDGGQNHHESIAQVRLCFARPGGLPSLEEEAYLAQDDAQAQSDWEAEQAAERYLENRGFDEARAQEAWEDARGVISFEDAMAAAEAEAHPGEISAEDFDRLPVDEQDEVLLLGYQVR
jgi:hypothetical protein